jgi:hypothetical protein
VLSPGISLGSLDSERKGLQPWAGCLNIRGFLSIAIATVSISTLAQRQPQPQDQRQDVTPPIYETSPEFKKAHPTREDNDLELTLATKTPVLVKGEPLLLNIDLKNVSPEPFRFNFTRAENQAEFDGFAVKVKNGNGEELPALPYDSIGRGFRSRSAYVLQSGQTVHEHLVVNHLVDISAPGTYTMYVTWKYQRSERRIQSNVITVEVRDK